MNIMISISIGGFAIMVILLILLILRDPILYERIRKIIFSITSTVIESHKRILSSVELQEGINRYIEDEGLIDLGCPRVKVDLVPQNLEGFELKEGEIIIKLGRRKERVNSILNAVYFYVGKAIIPQVKPLIKENVVHSIDLKLSDSILRKEIGHDAESVFKEKVLSPLFSINPKIKEMYFRLRKLDEDGTFTRVFLRELSELHLRNYERFNKQEITQDVLDFLEFLYTIAKKRKDEEVETYFQRELFNIFILLVAKRNKFLQKGSFPYLEAIRIAIKNKVSKIYILGRHECVDYCEYIAGRATRMELGKFIFKQKYNTKFIHPDGKKEIIPHICITLQISELLLVPPFQKDYS
ncbi:hypothetical protein KAW48_07550 [candidate division WOR-3 bacterium]|nr:hypothetical protein [candidate division WOR-3 bacterium]